ncbi:hypothetical protein AVEN_76843-1 [Araneus ventricosus]|uniref:RNase H type-1 domain-containing protein n=1 Tax=Araneus ventricosus TaxID=182803 RepID=A0A4Y2SB13_ARAVE|nr:hypothetical protein AVEN_76843-1 [Araneus ventricosus]
MFQAIGSVDLSWVKAHAGIPGSELADQYAKIATTDGQELNIPAPHKLSRQEGLTNHKLVCVSDETDKSRLPTDNNSIIIEINSLYPIPSMLISNVFWNESIPDTCDTNTRNFLHTACFEPCGFYCVIRAQCVSSCPMVDWLQLPPSTKEKMRSWNF